MAIRCWSRLFALSGVMLLVGIPAIPQDLASTLAARFESVYRHCNTLQATFLEKYLENGRVVRSEAGIAYFGKPGKMRWEYESPEHNLFVIDGKWSWFYVPADRTVTRIRAKDSTDWRTPLALLAGEVKISRICSEVRLDLRTQPKQPGGSVLTCSLRAGEGKAMAGGSRLRVGSSEAVERASFEINAQSGELLGINAIDSGGVQIEFRFADWRFNPPLERSTFQFTTPKGVAIVDGELATQPVH